MPRPRRALPAKRTTKRTVATPPPRGYLAGNNARRVGHAQKVLQPALRQWFASFGSLESLAKRTGAMANIITKVATLQCVPPERWATDWPGKLSLEGDERRTWEHAVALCATHLDALAAFPNWDAVVEGIGDDLSRFARRRVGPSRRRRYTE